MFTSALSWALRRDSFPAGSEVRRLREALGGGETVYTPGLIFQELLQGFRGTRAGAPNAAATEFRSEPSMRRSPSFASATNLSCCRPTGISATSPITRRFGAGAHHDLAPSEPNGGKATTRPIRDKQPLDDVERLASTLCVKAVKASDKRRINQA